MPTQLAFPFAAMPCAKTVPAHWVGGEARAVAVAALPEVLLVIVAGRSAETKPRKVGAAAIPELGPARMLFAPCIESFGTRIPLVVIGEPATVVS